MPEPKPLGDILRELLPVLERERIAPKIEKEGGLRKMAITTGLPDGWYSIGDVARMTGITVRRLRYLRDSGRFVPSGTVPREGNTAYVYSDADVAELKKNHMTVEVRKETKK